MTTSTPPARSLALAVALGAGVGGVVRVLVGTAALRWLDHDFPHGVLAVNVTGSFLIGLLMALTAADGRWPLGPAVRAGAMAGFCGGFTTFSFFSLQTLELLQAGRIIAAVLYAGITLAGALTAVWLGYAAGMRLNRRPA
ncbi:MAG: fluoride efflux transporter CrcB [Opitutaceae bacterium]|nr:fluoride efflux transporter CrcB [Opitutaceae bacterium]